MKSKTTKVRRYLAAILTVLMVFQQATTSVIYASSEAAVPTVTEAPAAQTEETPEKQVEETPEEKTPTEGENEGEESATPTEAPAENEAEPEVTVTPAAEPTATEAPAVEATATPVPEATEVPEATPTEVPKKMEFSGTVDNAMATVSLSEPISEDAVFVARQYADGNDYFDNAIDAAGSWLTANGYDGGQVIDAAVYDMHFEKNGQEIAVNQNATVNLQFIKPILTETVDGVPTSVHVLHIVNGTAVEAGSLNTDANGAVTVANINTNGFSPFVFVKTVNGDVTQTADNTETDLSKFFTSMTVSVDGTEVKDDTLVKPDSTFEFSIAFAESSSQNRMAQTVHFDMPNKLVNWAESGVLKEKGSDEVAANYTVDQSGHVTVTFTDEFMSKAAQGYLAGDFYFKAGIKRSVEEEEVTITVPGTSLEKKIKFNLNASLEASKNATYDPVSGEITYTVTVTAKEGEVTDINVTDTLGESLSLVKADDGKDYSLKIGEQVTTGDFVDGVVTISSLKAGQSAVLTYKAKFKDGILNNFAEIDTNKTKNSVTAKGKNGSKDVISNTPEVNIGDQFKNYKWISKSGNVQDQNGKIYINWTVTYNESKLVSVKGNTVTDTIPENEGKISFKKNDKITVKRSDGKTFEITVPSDGKTWSYTIGSNSGDTYGNEKESYSYEFTYTTEIDANELADVYGNVTVQNGVSDDKGHSAQKDVSVAGKIGEPTKICTGVTAEKASWKVTIHVPASGMKFWFSDQVQQVTNNNGDWSRYGEIDPDSINITGTDKYYYQPEIDGRKTTGYLFFGADVGSQNTIQLNQANSQLPASINGAYDVIITYDTWNKYYKDQDRNEQASMDADAEVKNTIKINGSKEVGASGIIPGDLKVEKVQTSNYHYYDNYYANTSENLCYVIKIDTTRSGLGSGKVTVYDSHSKGLQYIDKSAAVMRSTSTYSTYGTEQNDDEKAWVNDGIESVTENGNKITFNLRNLNEKASDGRPYIYFLYYRMKVDDNLTTSSEGMSLDNTAVIKSEDSREATTNTVSYNYKKPLLGKNQISLSNGYRAQFEITVPSATKYMTNGNLIVQDEYSNNLLIDNSSFGVTDQNGTPLSAGTEYSVTQNANGMQIEIKNAIDGNTYKIVYEAFVVGAPGAVINYTNTAYIPGHEEQYFKYTNSVTKNQVSGGSVGVQSYKFSIFKSGSDDQAVGLEGAEFTLYQGERVLTDKIKTGKDGKTGEIQSSDLNGHIMEPYVQYRLRETKAPDEYQILSEDIYFYFTNDSKSENDISSLGLKGTALYTGQTLNITNQKRTQGEVEYQFGVKKQVEGTNNCDTEFRFVLKDNAQNEIGTVTTKGAGTANFAALKFTEAGTYTYTVEETSKAPSEDAYGKWSYDNEPHTVTIKVVKNTESNTLEIEKVTGVDNGNVVITNSYTEKKPAKVTYQFGVEKKVEGVSNCETKFSFALKDKEGTVIDTAEITGAGTASFKELEYTEAGTYTYKVTETSQAPSEDVYGSWKYDNTEHIVTVTVEKDEAKNALKIGEVKGVDEHKNVTITNAYTEKTPGETVCQLGVNKQVKGTDSCNADFSFALKDKDGKEIETVTTKGAGTVNFAALKFTEAGTYTYTVEETSTAPEADAHGEWSYDNTQHTVTIEVVKNTETNTLEIKNVTGVDNDRNVVITNTYTEKKPAKVTYQFGVEKKVEGVSNCETKFSFALKDKEGTVIDTAEITGAGTASFKELEYTEAGTYTYKVTETSQAPSEDVYGSWKYDNTEHIVTVTVEKDEAKNALKIGEVKGVDEHKNVTITNAYTEKTPGETVCQLGVNKQVKGTDSCNADFSFALKDKDGKEIETVTTKGAGTVNFTALKFTEAGTYTYTVEETSKAPSEDAYGKWSYDNAQHTVTIEVVKNTETNTLEIKNVTGVDKDRNVVITNTYTEKTPEEVTYQLGVEKKVEGIDNCKTKFSFDLKDETGNVIETITTEGAEVANFAILKFTKEGTYKYTVTETSQEPDADKNGSWKYDNTAHAVIVTVKKNVETNILEIEKVEGVDSNNNVVITNIYTKTKDVSVKVSKVDAKTYEVLGGAHLQVIDPDGKVVAEWDSDKDAYTLTDLKPGVVYTLHETAAPKGYKVAEDTTFQLNEDGTIDTANTTTAISDDTLLVKDEKKESKDVSVSVTKKLVTVDGTVIGAVDATYYVALYSDADCTQRVSDVLALNFKNASSSTVTFTGLEKGQTYYVGECEADGTCYLANICADGTMYMVDFSDGNAVTVDNADGSTTVYFDNQFENIPDGYYKEAELNITKKLVGSDGKAKNSNEIFYAGIFADEGFTQLSTDVSENIVPLDLAGGSEATAQVNVALPESGSITLYVTEVDSNGKPVAGAASFKYDVTVDNTQVTLNDDNLSANVVITNKESSTKVTPTPGTPNTPNTTGGFSGKSAVRTGDSTPIGGFIALFAAAAVIAGAAVFFKRRRKDEK